MLKKGPLGHHGGKGVVATCAPPSFCTCRDQSAWKWSPEPSSLKRVYVEERVNVSNAWDKFLYTEILYQLNYINSIFHKLFNTFLLVYSVLISIVIPVEPKFNLWDNVLFFAFMCVWLGLLQHLVWISNQQKTVIYLTKTTTTTDIFQTYLTFCMCMGSYPQWLIALSLFDLVHCHPSKT